MSNNNNVYGMTGKFEAEPMCVVTVQFGPISAASIDDVNENTQTLCEWIDRAVAGYPNLDLLVTTECAFQGFGPGWKNSLISIDGPQLQRVKDKAKEYKIWIICNPVLDELEGHKACNTCLMINPEGEIVHKYVKWNPWVPGEPTYPGWMMPVTPGPKGSRIATIICYDGDFPEMFRQARLAGANVIVRTSHAMAPVEDVWELTNRTAAYCNQCYVVAANSVGTDECYTYFGRSLVAGPDGNLIVEAATGINWITKADILPTYIDYLAEKAPCGSFLYAVQHRSSAHPETKGVGADMRDLLITKPADFKYLGK